jgi:hypothetical protein
VFLKLNDQGPDIPEKIYQFGFQGVKILQRLSEDAVSHDR